MNRAPPLSATAWVYPPGTYLSRLTLTVVAAGLALVYTAYYFRQIAHGSPAYIEGLILRLALSGCVSMGVVGAVCENPRVPSCDVGLFFGIHDLAAMFTFGIATLYSMRAVHMLPVSRSSLPLKLLAFCSLISKARWFVSPLWSENGAGGARAAVGDPSFGPFIMVPILEWSDCLFLVLFFAFYSAVTMRGFSVAYIQHGFVRRHALAHTPPDGAALRLTPPAETPRTPRGLSAEAGRRPSADAPQDVHASGAGLHAPGYSPVELAWLTEKRLVAVVRRMVHGTVSCTFCLSWMDGTVQPLARWPALSDMWVSPPSNMISRYMVCLGALVCALSQVSHRHLSDGLRERTLIGCGYYANGLLHALSYTGLAGLAIVGACNLDENFVLHSVGACLFFGLHVVYFGLDALWSAQHARRSTTALAAAAWLVAAGAGGGLLARATGARLSSEALGVGPWVGVGPWDILDMCEWACLGAFTVLLKTSTDAFDGQPTVHLALLGPAGPAPSPATWHGVTRPTATATASSSPSGLCKDPPLASPLLRGDVGDQV